MELTASLRREVLTFVACPPGQNCDEVSRTASITSSCNMLTLAIVSNG